MSAATVSREVIFQAKKELRKAMKRKLGGLTQEAVVRQSEAVMGQVQRLGLLDRAARDRRAISCYLSMPTGELNTDALVEQALQQGIPTYVPVIPPRSTDPEQSSDMHFLRLYSPVDFRQSCTARDRWGIPDAGRSRRDVQGEDGAEDGVAVAREDAMAEQAPPLQVIFTPGMAFDRSCRRLGHGKGYYDRYFARYSEFADKRETPRPLLAALALNEQILPAGEEVPMTEDDELLDLVIHPAGVIWRDDAARQSLGNDASIASPEA